MKLMVVEFCFPGGDIVFSSSKFIESEPPELKYEKLQILMETNHVSFEDLLKTTRSLANQKVHVIGDTIVDSFTYTAMIGGQTKTPTISVKYENEERFIGGAAVVALHLRQAGATVKFTSILGNDSHGKFVRKGLKNSGLHLNLIEDETRPTTNKNAIIANKYRLLKLDRVDNRSIDDGVRDRICDDIGNTDADIVIFSDFRHGIFSASTINALSKAIRPKVFKVADSQVASRWGNIYDFKNFDLITPNEREARFSSGDQDSGIRPLASKVFRESGSKTLVMKLGERGVICCFGDNAEIPAFL